MIPVGKKDLQESSAKQGNGSYLSFLFAILTKDPIQFGISKHLDFVQGQIRHVMKWFASKTGGFSVRSTSTSMRWILSTNETYFERFERDTDTLVNELMNHSDYLVFFGRIKHLFVFSLVLLCQRHALQLYGRWCGKAGGRVWTISRWEFFPKERKRDLEV